MDELEKVEVREARGKSVPARAFRWLDKRTGVHDLLKVSLDEPIPGGARLAYVFGSGLLFIFISQIITGICLALYYVPSSETAHTSVAYITKQVAAGAFLRSLHYYGSSAMIIVLALHFLQTFLYGSFKGRRELLWISGAVLSLLVLAMGFTGYLLPWDQKAYFATAVGTNIVGEIPFIGNWLTRLLRGGDTIGTLTLSRFYVAHVFLIPGAIFLFIAAHIALFRKAGPAGPVDEDPVEPKLAPEGFYPRQVIMDMAFALLLMVGLGFLAYFHPVRLGPIANPADTLFLPRPEWYYLPMFEWLKFWEGPRVVFAVVIIPGLLALVFFLLPFLDRSLERRPWRRPIPVLAVAFVIMGIIVLGAKSHLDDKHDPGIAAQQAVQDQQERDYSAAPFEPYVESPGGPPNGAVPAGPVNPLVSDGRGLFEAHGCSGCHGETGMGTPAAIGLVGVTNKYPQDQLVAMLHNPTAKMRAGNMPAVDLSPRDMASLVAYIGVLGTSAANVKATFTAPQLQKAAFTSEVPATGPGALAARQRTEGQQMFQSQACFACHGAAGTGGRAPALAPQVAKLSDVQLIQVLQHPTARMKSGGMSPVAGDASQIAALIVFLRTLSPPAPNASAPAMQEAEAVPATMPVETVGGEPVSTANPAAQPANEQPVARTEIAKPSVGRTLFVAQGCAACHGAWAQGTRFAPTLTSVETKYPGEKLAALLRHPTSAMRNGGMPVVTLDDAQLHQLIAYLDTLNLAQANNRTAAATTPTAGTPAPRAGAAVVPESNPEENAREVNALTLTPEERAGQKVFQRNGCESCHGAAGLHGTVAAPGLAGTASILPSPMLENLLRHHSIKMQQGGMPLTNMNARDMHAIIAYIRSITPAGSE